MWKYLFKVLIMKKMCLVPCFKQHIFVILQFLNLDAYWGALLNSDWPYSSGIGKIWMFSYQIIWRFENQMSDQNVMGPWSKLMRLAIFSWYFNYLNSDFDPWAIVLNGIQYYLQWHWFYPDQMVASKVNPRSNLVKVDKKLK